MKNNKGYHRAYNIWVQLRSVFFSTFLMMILQSVTSTKDTENDKLCFRCIDEQTYNSFDNSDLNEIKHVTDRVKKSTDADNCYDDMKICSNTTAPPNLLSILVNQRSVTEKPRKATPKMKNADAMMAASLFQKLEQRSKNSLLRANEFKCSIEGNHRDEFSPRWYWSCDRAQDGRSLIKVHKKCPQNHIFEPISNECTLELRNVRDVEPLDLSNDVTPNSCGESSTQVNCIVVLPSTDDDLKTLSNNGDASPAVPSVSSSFSSSSADSCDFKCPCAGSFPDPHDETSYIQCIDRGDNKTFSAAHMNCPQNMKYDDSSKRCKNKEEKTRRVSEQGIYGASLDDGGDDREYTMNRYSWWPNIKRLGVNNDRMRKREKARKIKFVVLDKTFLKNALDILNRSKRKVLLRKRQSCQPTYKTDTAKSRNQDPPNKGDIFQPISGNIRLERVQEVSVKDDEAAFESEPKYYFLFRPNEDPSE